MDTDPSQPEQPLIHADLIALLWAVVVEMKVTDEKATDALWRHRDAKTHDDLLKKRAQLIADLPEMLSAFEKSGYTVPEDVQVTADELSTTATRALKQGTDGGFTMSVLLIPRGSVGEKNQLEKLIEQLVSLG